MFTDILKMILPPLIQIIQQLLPVLLPIIEALLPLLKPIFDLLTWVITNVLQPIITYITNIATIISSVLVVALKALTPVVNGVKNVFQNVFGGLMNIVKTPINFIIDGINTFIRGLNKIKIPDWVPGFGGKGINLPFISRLRVGIEEVPYDEMPAILHKGERVLTKEEAEEYDESKNRSSEVNYSYYNNITIEHLEVKEEKDIERIAEELYYLQKKEV